MNDYINIKLLEVCKEITYRFLSPANKLGTILHYKSWDLDDFAMELWLHIKTHNRSSTNRFREKWLTDYWDWNDIGLQKQFRAWVKVEVKAFVGRIYYREFVVGQQEAKKALCFTYLPEYELLVATTPLGELMFETNDIIDVMKNYVDNYATEREKFIYLYSLDLIQLEWENGRLINYPEGSVTKKTFYLHRKDFLNKLKGEIGDGE